MLTEVYAIVRKSDGCLAWDRALYATETRAKIALRTSCPRDAGEYRIVRLGGVVTPVWETVPGGKWTDVEKTEVSVDGDETAA